MRTAGAEFDSEGILFVTSTKKFTRSSVFKRPNIFYSFGKGTFAISRGRRHDTVELTSQSSLDFPLIFSEELGPAPEPYERLLGDALRGDSTLFTREDSVEETWRIVQPLLDSPPPVEVYQPGSWGPKGAAALVAGEYGWRQPWTDADGKQ